MKAFLVITATLALFLAGPLITLASGRVDLNGDWRTASRRTTGQAPDPAGHPGAIVQVYAARAFNWRGIFGVHSWIAVKPRGAPRYTVYEVIGWRAFHGRDPVVTSQRDPDARWYGSRPTVLAELRGAAAAIPRIVASVGAYPYRQTYRIWPGPNSNTFTAFVARRVPALRLDLPPTAIGKDYLPNGALFARAPSGTGGQFSVFGLFGVLVAVQEGVEVNVLGLSLGIDPLHLAIKLPGLGSVGL